MNSNRGMFLETVINRTIAYYAAKNIAYFAKRYLPIKVYSFNGNRIQGWLSQKTETDYYGLFKGYYLDFEAKQTKSNSLPIANIKSHQIKHMQKILDLNGLVFFIIYFQKFEKFYLLEFTKFLKFVTTNKTLHSLSYKFVHNHGYNLDLIYPGILDLVKILELLITKKLVSL